MDFLHAEIEKEYKRWQNIIGPDDPYQSNDTIGLHELLAAHFLMIDYFAEKKYGQEALISCIPHSPGSLRATAESQSGMGFSRTAPP
jgi:hypothetical protein